MKRWTQTSERRTTKTRQHAHIKFSLYTVHAALTIAARLVVRWLIKQLNFGRTVQCTRKWNYVPSVVNINGMGYWHSIQCLLLCQYYSCSTRPFRYPYQLGIADKYWNQISVQLATTVWVWVYWLYWLLTLFYRKNTIGSISMLHCCYVLIFVAHQC